jgi:hypothetical protein
MTLASLLKLHRVFFLIPQCIASSSLPGTVAQCWFIHLEGMPHAQALSAIGSRLFATRFFGLCGHKQKKKVCETIQIDIIFIVATHLL